MDKVITFFKEAYVELVEKVTWPKVSELQNSSVLVLVASLIFALCIFVFDMSFKNIMEWFYKEF